MARKAAPAGSRKMARQITAYAKKQRTRYGKTEGIKRTAQHFKVHPSTVYKWRRVEIKHKAAAKVITTKRGLAAWDVRLGKVGKKVSAQATKARIKRVSEMWTKKDIGEMSGMTYQKVSRVWGKLGRRRKFTRAEMRYYAQLERKLREKKPYVTEGIQLFQTLKDLKESGLAYRRESIFGTLKQAIYNIKTTGGPEYHAILLIKHKGYTFYQKIFIPAWVGRTM